MAVPDPDVLLERGWLPPEAADRLFAALLQELPWSVHRIRMFGRWVDSPRLSCWLGDPGTEYAYSGGRFEPLPWPPALAELRERLVLKLEAPFNSALANLYRNGNDYVGWHRDNERELGPHPLIASISLGAARRFVLRANDDCERQQEWSLEHGDLLVMAGSTQQYWKHALPKSAKMKQPRINLTFRVVRPGEE